MCTRRYTGTPVHCEQTVKGRVARPYISGPTRASVRSSDTAAARPASTPLPERQGITLHTCFGIEEGDFNYKGLSESSTLCGATASLCV